jgi:hypothetical protein
MAVPMANDPPFATLNHFAADLGIPSESDLLRIGISWSMFALLRTLVYAVVGPPNPTLGSLNLSCRTGHSIYSYNSFGQLGRRC